MQERHTQRVYLSLPHRKDTKTIFLRNSTLLPVAWRVNGMDNLGDDFSLTTEHGVIDAKSEFALQMHFRAVRPTNVKKIVRLEVHDSLFYSQMFSKMLSACTLSARYMVPCHTYEVNQKCERRVNE